jgi:hypothetical protein
MNMDLDALYKRMIKDGGGVSKIKLPQGVPPIVLDSPESEEKFRRLLGLPASSNSPNSPAVSPVSRQPL